MANRNRNRNMMVLNLLASGKGMTEVSRETGLTFATIQGIRRSVAALSRPGLTHRSVYRFEPWTVEDELPDQDEPIGPVARCKCGLVLPCNMCLSVDYVLDCRSAAKSDNHQIDPYAEPDANLLQGKTAKGVIVKSETTADSWID